MAIEEVSDRPSSIAIASGETPSVTAKSFWARIVAWLDTCADYRAAAALYEELRHLSDAELRRRGLSRESLARDICAARERHG